MANQSFWLADIGDHSVAVSYVVVDSGHSQVTSIGPACPWDESNPQSFTTAVDQSLSESASSVGLPQESEPDSIALIIPPFWVGSDGKIVSEKRKLLETVSKELKLRPMGFIANDEAIVEAANLSDGFPASFVLANITPSQIIVSLTYLGRVTERIVKNFAGSFDPEYLESAIVEFKSESALPPQIILFGQVDPDIIESVKNYSWIGKKNIETFLHFPEVKAYTIGNVASIYSQAIASQFSPPSQGPELSKPEAVVEIAPELEVECETDPEVNLDVEPVSIINSEILPVQNLSEVSPEELGFADVQEQNFTIPQEVPTLPPQLIIDPIVIAPEPQKEKKKNTLPKFSFSKIKFQFTNIFLIPLVVSPLLILIPFYFSTAHLILYLTPYTFSKTASVTFDPQAQDIDLNKKTVPIKRQNIQVPTTLSLNTTGQKTVGDKAKGEVTIFNKQDKTQSIAAGSILIDSQGNHYTLDNNVQIPASSSNLDLGVITLGQVKVTASASDIGPEFNLAKDSSLHFKDYSESLVVAKSISAFSGGSKRQISAVAAADKAQLESKLTAELNSEIQKRLDQEVSQNPNIIRDATQIQKGRIDYNREVGEESDQLTGSVASSIYIFYLDPQKKLDLLNALLTTETGFSDSIIDPSKFNLSINPTKGSIDKISGQLIITGTSLPKTNTPAIAKLISGKTQTAAIGLIKKTIPRVYNYQLDTNFKFIKLINPLPFRLQNILIEFK